MKKIPTAFLRDEQDRRYVTDQPNPATAWIGEEDVAATRKYDGTCVLLDAGGDWWARREVKQGKTAPPGFVVAQVDDVTGKTVGWEPIEQSPFVKFWREAVEGFTGYRRVGTYELIGPKVNGNPEQVDRHQLIAHAEAEVLPDVPTDYAGLRDWLAEFDGEGIVWHHHDGRMAKLKVRDFPFMVRP